MYTFDCGDDESTETDMIPYITKMQKRMKNTEQLHKKSAFLNKFKPEQRTSVQLADGNPVENDALITH